LRPRSSSSAVAVVCNATKEQLMRALVNRTLQWAAVIVAAATWSVGAQQSAAPQVTAQDLRDGLKDASRWLT
jgi:hypothetical protein